MIKEVLKTFRKPALLFSASLGLCLGMACQDDVVAERQPIATGDEIMFAVASDSIGENQSVGAISRSASKVSTHFLTTIGKDSLYLEVREEENNRPFHTVAEDTVASRGAAYSNDAFKNFFLTAYLDDGAQFMNDTYVEKKNGSWTYSPVKYWPQNQAVHFFGYARSMDKGTLGNHNYMVDKENGSYSHSFDYTMPSGNATQQPDLVVAITPNQTKQSINGKVHLEFRHALSAVVFKVDEVPNETKLKSISFSGLYASGTGTINETGAITWKNSGSSDASYSQSFNLDGYLSDTEGSETVISTINEETCFMMVPQTFTDKAEITFSFAIGTNSNNDYTVSMPLKDILTQWDASKVYTFIIKLKDDVKIDIEEDFTQGTDVKKNVMVTNSGVSKIYVRTTVVGCWVNSKGDALASWIAPDDISSTAPADADGEFVLPASWSNNWIVGADGYYYYKYPISYHDTTAPLFDSYTLKAAPPVAGTTLELSVIAQSVYVDDIEKTGWPVTVGEDGNLQSKE